jgi:predicted phosphoadenosine phosphosulfate sulfurtransferase
MAKAIPTGAGLRMFLKQDVLQAAYDRLEWLFDEFGHNVYVSVSGGKDSTVLFHLALEVARRKGLTPLKCFWIDQEAEWQGTVDIVTDWMTTEDIEPIWLQVPFRIFNATSQESYWLHAWAEDERALWMHDRHPVAKTENIYGTDRFHELFPAALAYHFGDEKACSLAGVRTEEARTRFMGLTHYATYKWITWGSKQNERKQQFTFHPLYDWSYTDIWKFIHERDIPYNPVYDAMWQRGAHVREMRVSNLSHETAVTSMFQVQEVEPATYDKLINRIEGIHSAMRFGTADYFPTEVPWMFDGWLDYRDHLLVNLTPTEHQARLRDLFARMQRDMPPEYMDRMAREHVKSILTNDWEGERLEHFAVNQDMLQKKYKVRDARKAAEADAEPV